MSVILVEIGTRLAFSRVSRIEQRIAAEHAGALTIRPASNRKSVLLIGNSLLLEGVDQDLLRRSLRPGVEVHRFIIESTGLFDWKYGLRRLFADGARPDVIVVSVGETNILPTAIRGDYSAFYLFRTADLREIADSVGMDNTRLANLYFARYSLFFAGRAGLRNFFLNRVDPAYAELLHALGTHPAEPAPESTVEAAAVRRLGEMRELSAKHGARLILLVPPGFAANFEEPVARGAYRAGVPVISPVPQSAWGVEKFRDRFHLNAVGAREFTRLLAPQLMAAVLGDSVVAANVTVR